MKKILILILSIALITVGCTGNANNPEKEDIQEPENTDIQEEENNNETRVIMAPDFELKSLEDDSLVKLSDMRDKNVILNFWYKECPFCVMEMPDLQKLQETYIDDLTVLTINVGDSKETAQTFLDEENLDLKVLMDENMVVANTYGIRAYPTTIAINKRGEIAGGQQGMLTYEQMEVLYSFLEE